MYSLVYKCIYICEYICIYIYMYVYVDSACMQIFVSMYQSKYLSIHLSTSQPVYRDSIYPSINPILIWIFILSSINPIYHLSEASFYHFNMKYHISVFFILVYLSMYHLSEAPFSPSINLGQATNFGSLQHLSVHFTCRVFRISRLFVLDVRGALLRHQLLLRRLQGRCLCGEDFAGKNIYMNGIYKYLYKYL